MQTKFKPDSNLSRDIEIGGEILAKQSATLVKPEDDVAVKAYEKFRQNASAAGTALELLESYSTTYAYKAYSKDVAEAVAIYKKIHSGEAVNVFQQRLLSAYSKDVHTIVSLQDTLVTNVRTGKLNLKPSETDFLSSKHFFDVGSHYGAINNILQKSFYQSSNELLRQIRPLALSDRKLKKLISNPQKYNISSSDLQILRFVYHNKRKSKAFIKAGKYRGVNGLSRGLSAATFSLDKIDSYSTAGIRKARQIYSGGISALEIALYLAKTSKKTSRAISRITGLDHATYKYIKKPIKRKVEKFHDKRLEKIRRRRFARSDKFTSENIRTPTIKLSHRFDRLKNRYNKNSLKVSASIRNTKKITGKVSKPIKQTKRIVSLPFVFINKPANLFLKVASSPFRLIHSALLKLCGSFLIIVAAYVGLCVFCSFFLSMIKNTELTDNMIHSVIMSKDIGTYVDYLNDIDARKYADALVTQKAIPGMNGETDRHGPITNDVYGREKLYHYGSPTDKSDNSAIMYHNYIPNSESENGYHLYFIDGQGNVIGNNTNNIKECIAASTAMIGNLFAESIYEQTIGATDEYFFTLLDRWYMVMNPPVVKMVSDIYHVDGGDKFPHGETTLIPEEYYCNDSTFYKSYDELSAQGVHFYSKPVSASIGGGCYCPGHKGDDDETTYCDGCECTGHDALDCSYGYRDINIYITVLCADDIYKAIADPSHQINYKVPVSFSYPNNEKSEASTAEIMFEDRTIKLPDADGSAYLADFAASGGWDCLSRNEEYASLDPCNEGLPFHFYCSFISDLLSSNWYDTYGVETLNNGSGLTVGGSLTEYEIETILEEVGIDSGSLPSDLVEFSLKYVGKIPYYYGGRARCPGFDGNNFGSTVKADPKGRTKKGLDCSGFVNWVLWSTKGINPGGCAAAIGPSLHLPEFTDKSKLEPGDIGVKNHEVGGKTTSNNHIGIYAGNGMWIHCSSSSGVVISNYSGFKYFYKMR